MDSFVFLFEIRGEIFARFVASEDLSIATMENERQRLLKYRNVLNHPSKGLKFNSKQRKERREEVEAERGGYFNFLGRKGEGYYRVRFN